MDEPAFGPAPAVVWILNALEGKKQQTAAHFLIMLFRPAVFMMEVVMLFAFSFFLYLFIFALADREFLEQHVG